MKRKEPTVSVVHDKEHIPPGYVPLGTLATDSGSTPLYGYVQRAFDRGEWSRSLFRCRGKRFIHRDDLERLTAEFNARQAGDFVEFVKDENGTSSQDDMFRRSLAEIGCALLAIQSVLERMAVAVESIATQPKVETAGTWRDMNGESL